uniref:Sema domain, immunoglobulin domain (Ig), short basic domain, secreted, (semaphorin) 3B n=1 Tax=Cyprinus carpio TaxID=7962 RepID=A0A8C1SWZ5_CYPCA
CCLWSSIVISSHLILVSSHLFASHVTPSRLILSFLSSSTFLSFAVCASSMHPLPLPWNLDVPAPSGSDSSHWNSREIWHAPASTFTKEMRNREIICTDCVNYVKVLHHYNRTHLYACGTGAFHPTCVYVEVGQKIEDHVFKIDPSMVEDGKGKSPYDPRHTSASVLIGDELYAGVATDLMGRDFTIFRSMGQRPSIRTEQHDSRWLNEPKFIAAVGVPESENPDDDKVFFFFRETAVEAQGFGKVTYSRIGQLCRNDMGGQRSLVNKWTTFLKARLVCSVPGNDGTETHFDELRDVFLLQTRDRKNPLIYTVFTTSSSVFQGSAVCLYTMNDIRRAFLGPFAHKEGPNFQWIPFQGKVPYPRPGMCPSKTFGSFESTKGFPDNVIQFARHHPLMFNPVTPLGGRPLFLRTGIPYTFTQITVDRVNAADGHYDVMFIGTDIGSVLKVISVPKGSWSNTELLLEELQLFKVRGVCMCQQLYVGSDTGVVQVPLHRCSMYGKACAECCLARDPYCAWDGHTCTRYLPNTKRYSFSHTCHYMALFIHMYSGQRVLEKRLYAVDGSSSFLECIPKSLQAQITWTYQRHPENSREEVRLDDRVLLTERGLLLRRAVRRDGGVYQCHAMEHGFTQTILAITLEILPLAGSAPSAPIPRSPAHSHVNHGQSTNQKLWYRDFMQLVDHPNLNTVDQICEQVWSRKHSLSVKGSPDTANEAPVHDPLHSKKWKHLKEVRKGRNRRTHDGRPAPRSPRSAGK